MNDIWNDFDHMQIIIIIIKIGVDEFEYGIMRMSLRSSIHNFADSKWKIVKQISYS